MSAASRHRPTWKPPKRLWYPTTVNAPFKLICLACGDQDKLMRTGPVIDGYLKPHVWTVNASEHDGETSKRDLFQFVPLLFR